MHDIIVVGGGPGGLYTSVQLARQGFDVVVLEEHYDIGQPVHCTGILAAETFDEFDLPRDAVLNPLIKARFHSPSRRIIEYASPTIEAVVVDRYLFDQTIYLQAKTAGASVRVGQRVTSVVIDRDGVDVSVASGAALRSRACVLACGASYAIQRRLDLGMPSVYLQSAQIELPAGTSGDVELHFGQAVAPSGFAWIVPVSRRGEAYARVGLMCQRDAGGHFNRFVGTVRQRWGIDGRETKLAPRQKILPLAPIRKTYSDRLLAVGDAAGLVKATTGGGIYYSLVSAQIAASVLGGALRANDLSERRLQRYESTWRERLGLELQSQLTLRMLGNRLGDSEIEDLFELAQTDGIMPIVRRTARFNHHRDLIVSLLGHPPARRVLYGRLGAMLTGH